MSLPKQAIDLIKEFEGWHRALPDGRAAPYVCPAGVWTIGYGATFDISGKPITPHSAPITKEEGEILLMAQVTIFHRGVMGLVTAPVNLNQMGALTSFAFNLGLGRLKSSTLLRKVNAEIQGAADEFPKWVMGGGRKLPGLVRRRQAERALFLQPVEPVPTVQGGPPPGTVGSPKSDSGPSWLERLVNAFRRGQKGEF